MKVTNHTEILRRFDIHGGVHQSIEGIKSLRQERSIDTKEQKYKCTHKKKKKSKTLSPSSFVYQKKKIKILYIYIKCKIKMDKISI